MPRRSTVLAFIISQLMVLAFQYVGLVWSFADFHPGGDVEPNAGLTRQAELGSAMHLPFRLPLEWMQAITIRITGGYDFVSSPAYSTLYGVAHWAILPLIYGTFIFVVFRWIRGCLSATSKHA
jgi:hypothetical protein